MKQVSFTLFGFDELPSDVQLQVVERERFNVMDRRMELDNHYYRKTLKRFEELFSISVHDWSVDYCRFSYKFSVRDIVAYGYDYINGAGENVFGEFPLAELDGRLLRRYLDNNIVPYILKPHFYWNGASKSRSSRIIRRCCCPLTGDATDMLLLDPIVAFISSHDITTTYSQLIGRCLEAFFKAWHDEFLYWSDDDNAVRSILSEDTDTLYYPNGDVYTGPLDIAV